MKTLTLTLPEYLNCLFINSNKIELLALLVISLFCLYLFWETLVLLGPLIAITSVLVNKLGDSIRNLTRRGLTYL